MPKYSYFRHYILRKRQTSKQEKRLKSLKKDYSTFRLSKHEDLGRFLYPEIFPYANKDRLNRDFKNGVIQELHDIEIIVPRLSEKHQKEILMSDQFMRTINVILEKQKQKKSPKKEDELDNFSSSVMYQNFFNVGFEGLIKTMPKEFQEHLISQVKPIIQLMYAITKNYNKLSKNKIPEPQFPKLLLIDKLNNTV